jgi:hypothetical protein
MREPDAGRPGLRQERKEKKEGEERKMVRNTMIALVIALTGEAPSLETGFHASEVAHKVRGVWAVRNELELERKA